MGNQGRTIGVSARTRPLYTNSYAATPSDEVEVELDGGTAADAGAKVEVDAWPSLETSPKVDAWSSRATPSVVRGNGEATWADADNVVSGGDVDAVADVDASVGDAERSCRRVSQVEAEPAPLTTTTAAAADAAFAFFFFRDAADEVEVAAAGAGG